MGRHTKECACGRVRLIDGCAYAEGDFTGCMDGGPERRERHGRHACHWFPTPDAYPMVRIDAAGKVGR